MKDFLVTSACYAIASAISYLGFNALAAFIGLSPDFQLVLSF